MYLKIEEENAVYKIMKENKRFEWKDSSHTKEDIVHTADIWEVHPTETFTQGYEQKIAQGCDCDIYTWTHGSQNEEAAYVAFNSKGQILGEKKFKLPGYSNNFEAEAIVIKKAIEYAINHDNKSYQIITDSLSTSKAIKNPGNINPFVFEIKTLLAPK